MSLTRQPLRWVSNMVVNRQFAIWVVACAIFLRQFKRARDAADEAGKIDPQNLFPRTNAAHARMFMGDDLGAKTIYLKYRGAKLSDGRMWDVAILDDFHKFKAAKLPAPPLMTEMTSLFSAH